MLKKFLRGSFLQSIIKTLKIYKILSIEFAHYKSTVKWSCIDKDSNPIPWYTYPALEYIRQLDFSDKVVFEYGSGNSTLFWSERSKAVVAIEDGQEWYEKMRNKLPSNVEYIFNKDKANYINAINEQNHLFDIIIIDGNHRFDCAVEALKKLKQDGLIILDNSDWHDKTAKLLRDSDFIEVDMSGFGPINDYTWTTSFFFSRSIKLKPIQERQPVQGMGGIFHPEK